MKLDLPEIEISRSEDFEDIQFAIGDVSLVMEILRSKMYTNPIKVIVQEISSNGRDAHREIGTPDRAIEIKLPNRFDPVFHVRDWGRGITPENMRTVYVNYGVSTKRDSNEQTGGFGLGSKTPWSYTDSFTVTSITEEGDHNVKRQYAAYIDETNRGKLSLITSEPTSEHTGLTVAVGCKPGDIETFAMWTKYIMSWWKVRPVVVGDQIDWPTFEYQYEGDDWFIIKNTDRGYNSYSSVHNEMSLDSPMVLLDEIPYPIDKRSIEQSVKDSDKKELTNAILRLPIKIKFGVGDVGIIASREGLDYGQQKTIDGIVKRVGTIVDGFTEQCEQQVKDCKNLWEAYTKYIGEIKPQLGHLIGTPKWQGVELKENGLSSTSGTEVWLFQRTLSSDKKECLAVRSRKVYSVHFDANSALIIDNTENKTPSKSRIGNFFLCNTNYECAYVIKFVDTSVYNRTTQVTTKKSADEVMKSYIADNRLDLMKVVYLSNVDKMDPKKGSLSPNAGTKQSRYYTYGVPSQGYYTRPGWIKGGPALSAAPPDSVYVNVLVSQKQSFMKDCKAVINKNILDWFTGKNISYGKPAIQQIKRDLIGVPIKYKKAIPSTFVHLEDWFETEFKIKSAELGGKIPVNDVNFLTEQKISESSIQDKYSSSGLLCFYVLWKANKEFFDKELGEAHSWSVLFSKITKCLGQQNVLESTKEFFKQYSHFTGKTIDDLNKSVPGQDLEGIYNALKTKYKMLADVVNYSNGYNCALRDWSVQDIVFLIKSLDSRT